MTYFEQRMKELKVTPENNRITVRNEEAEFPMSKVSESPIFSEDKEGNIEILYTTIDRKVYTYLKSGSGKMSDHNAKPTIWTQKRLKTPKGDMKYQNPYGQPVHPFFAPMLCDAYEKEEELETIYLTEGAFKGWLGCLHGIPVVGLPSISNYKNEEKSGLHQEIIKLILKCKVQNVVILWDGDCRNLSEKALSVGKPLTDRPLGFYANARNLRKAIRAIPMPEGKGLNVFFASINSEYYEGEPKAIDDLLIEAEKRGEVDLVKERISRLRKSKMFHFSNITRGQKELFRWFGLSDVHSFYAMHEDFISDEQFFFFGDLCQWVEGNEGESSGKVKVLTYGWTKNTYWIGDEFFKMVTEPGVVNRARLVKFKKETLQKLHKNPKFHTYLDWYAGFCCKPSHFNYQLEHEIEGNTFFNLYHPFPHTAKEGSWENIRYFLKHIFGEEERTHAITGEKISSFEMGLDYLQLMLTQPTRRLPILCLFSRENRTGKSTFGNLQMKIFGDNVAKVGNNDFQSDFNEPFAGKLLAISEETSLDRRKDSERIKDWSTAKQITVNAKNQRQYSIDFFTKFQFYSNNPRMIYLTAHDDRYWVIKVGQFKKEIPDLEDRMEAEIPAFLHFLLQRRLATKDEGRMWMHPSLYIGAEFKEMVKVNEPGDVGAIRDGIMELFHDFPEVKKLRLTMKAIRDECFGGKKIKQSWLEELLRDYLQVSLEINPKTGKPIRNRGTYQKYEFNEHGADGAGFELKTIPTRGGHYVFFRSEFVKEEPEYEQEAVEKEDDFTPDPNDVKKLPISQDDELPF